MEEEEEGTKVKLFILYNGYATVEGFHEYLMNKVPKNARNFTVTPKASDECDGGTGFEVEFESKNKAKQSLAKLRKITELRVSSTESFSQSMESEINDFILSLQRNRGSLLVNIEDKINTLKLGILTLPKRCALGEYEKIVQQKNVINQQIEECELQCKEFDEYCSNILTELKCILTSDQLNNKSTEDRIIKLQAKFGIECHKVSKALPMYARRQKILSTIAENQVCILIGETGSGKSTQLVQYLYDAGIASDGIIVCTQPRKVAAVSLANHVSREMCVKLGEELGYKTGMSGKYNVTTKVLYMTDHALLNECIKDKNFTKYSCLVIDEAHERSLHTDLLLSFVKKCLPNRKDLRVVITSATIDPVVFVEYFGNDCPVIRVPGRAYPVETLWKPIQSQTEMPTTDEYTLAAIDMVETIHATKDPGDILVFLTSPGEVEIACQLTGGNLDKNSTVVLPLHGKMQPVDQQKVFQLHEGKRKVIFCTNIAETSVTIDGVKFVVDTGMAKELHFDPKRNMNSLEVCRISKSSAEQRKGRAGRTSAGKCFRLYSKEIYDNMRDRMLPELLRVHLTLAVLKLYEFGVENVLEFEFVEQPDPSTLREAVKILKFVDAISDAGLTDKGKILATLPIDPQLGKVLLDGIEAGIGLEAAIVVAMSAVGGGIFFRAGTDVEKAASDKKKLQFCHEAGDQMTCLCIYWNWMSQHKEARNQWCFANSINAKSMRRVEETVKELQKIVLTHAVKIPTTVKDLKNAEAHLPKIFFFSFLNNIAVFTGHERAGYILTENQNDSSFVFPGSVLSSQNLVPQYLVYEKLLKTSRQFLLQVMPVKPEWINEAVSIGKLALDPAERFREYLVSAVLLTGVGWQMFKKAYIDSDKIKQEFKEACQNSPHSVDTLMTKKSGVVKVYAQPRYHGHARSLLEKRFNEIRKEFMKEQHELGVTAESDDVRLVLGRGGQIQHVLMPGDCMTIVIKGPLNTEWTTGVLRELTCLGDICSTTCKSFKKEHRMYTKFYDPKVAANAMAVLSECHGIDEGGVTVEFSKKHMGSQCVTTLKVEWCRRMRRNFAHIIFEDPMDATRLILYSASQHGYRFRPDRNVSPGDRSYKVFVPNVPENHTQEHIENAVNACLSGDSVAPNVGFRIQLGYDKSFPTSPEKFHQLKHRLQMLIEKYTQPNKYKIEMSIPKDFFKTYRAFVNIIDVNESHKIFDGLVNEEIDGHRLTVIPQLSSIVVFSNKVFSVIKKDIERVEAALKQHHKDILSIKKVADNTNIKYELKSEDMQAYIDAKQMLNNTTLPTIKDCRSQPILRQFLLSSGCQEVMNDIQQRTSTVIIINRWMVTISVYGIKETKAEAISLIEDHFDKLLQSDVKSFDIPLKQPGRPPGLMKHIVSQFGLDLEKLVKREGISGATLNVNKHILSVSSTPEAYKTLLQEIESFTSSAVHPAENQEVVECCVCWTEVDSEGEVFRLEYCGHSYCIECIQIQVTSPTAVFPVLCAADQCSQPLVVQDFTALCRRVTYTMQQLCEASLRSYITANPDRVRNCCTPDCKMIYAVSEVGEKFFCGLCGVSICTKCHVQYHDNLTCAMYQSPNRMDSDIQKWIMEDSENRKRCPKCNVGIEKTGGCNHITCECGVHICWVCLEYFDSSGSCYAHLATSHGSFV